MWFVDTFLFCGYNIANGKGDDTESTHVPCG